MTSFEVNVFTNINVTNLILGNLNQSTSSTIAATVTGSATFPYAEVDIYGASGSTAVLEGDGTSGVVVSNLGDASQSYIETTNGDLGTIETTGIANLQVSNGAGDITVANTDRSNAYDITPTAPTPRRSPTTAPDSPCSQTTAATCSSRHSSATP